MKEFKIINKSSEYNLKADSWEVSGNGLRFFIKEESIAWFLEWSCFFKIITPSFSEESSHSDTSPDSPHSHLGHVP